MIITIDGKQISEEKIDAWKLNRIKKVMKILNSKIPISNNVEQMTEILTDIKQKFSYEQMFALLKRKLMISTFVMKIAVMLSGKKRRFSITKINVDGISAKEIAEKIDKLMVEASPEYNRVNLMACPDHYVLRTTGKNTLEVIETTGNSPLPVHFFILYNDETGLLTPRDNSYDYQSVGVAKLKNGTLIGGVRHQFKDTSTGFEAKLVVEFPILCPNTITNSHQLHLATEFSSWFTWIINNRASK